ncbi:cell division protein FtsZ [Sulfurimonas crateris]|nr:cell division protein FtsZ [Sulfurimonas crateris]
MGPFISNKSEEIQKNRIVVVGFGKSGSHVVESMIKTQGTNIEFITINSDDDYKNIINTLEGADIVFITGGLGGQTGYAAVPEIAKFAKHAGALTILVTTKPFVFEKKKRHVVAQESLAKVKKEADCVVIISNDKIFSTIDRKLNNSEIFKIADGVITQTITGIIGTLSANSQNDININIEDLQSIMSNSGMAFVGIGESQGEEAAYESITSAIEFAKNCDTSIEDASGILVHFTMHPEFYFIKIMDAMHIVSSEASDSADIIFGTTADETLPVDFIRVTILIAGFEKISLVAANNVQ